MMENKLLEVRAVSAPWNSGIEFVLRSKSGDHLAVAKPIVMETINDHTMVDPTFCLSMDKAQLLMDDLWQAGIRPTEGTGSAGSLAATKYHLEDMRKLVFEKERSIVHLED